MPLISPDYARSLLLGRQGKGRAESLALAGRGLWQAGGGCRWTEKQKRPKVPAGQAVYRCVARCAIKAQSDSETEDTVESQGVPVR